MFISNGIDVDPSWKDSIAWSDNNYKWNTIKFDGITVEYRKKNKRSGALNTNSGHDFSISLADEGEEKLRFTLPVLNQPTWTNDSAGAKQAVDDITTWISVSVDNQDTMISLLSDLISEVDNKGVTTQISVPCSVTSVSLVPAQLNRVEAIITNNSNKDMWISFGSSAALDQGTILRRNDIMILDRTDEEIFGIWKSGCIGSAVIQHTF